MPEAPHSESLANLDLVRSTAVCLVVAQHYFTQWDRNFIGPFVVGKLGELGVWLFFVHTCLVLMQSLERQHAQTPQGLFGRFIIRRAFRLYPLSIAAVSYCWFRHLTSSYLTRPLTGFEWFTNLALVQNLFDTPSMPTALWSLPVELQMYLLLPGLFLLARRLKSIKPLLAIWLLAVPVAVWLPIPRLFDVVHYIPFFLPGVVAWWAFRNKAPVTLPSWSIALLLAILILVYSIAPVHAVGFVLAMQLGLLLPAIAQIQSRHLTAVTKQIAKYSYGIYLSHLMILSATQAYFHSPLLTIAPFVILTSIISIAFYHLLEDPMIQLGKRITSSPRPLAISQPA